ncbi:MAG TPA: tetratricopeptide repeat protein [Steroidobacteraceae bacterium]|jgi:serine/threonine protein kinase/lipopolysaccharide biosynthesis regulator YciM
MKTGARWQQIHVLFDELLDLEEPARTRQLKERCGDDAELRASVQSLLDSDMKHGDPFQHAVGAAAESLLEDHRDRLIGTQVGRYRIVSVLGHGGMSTVYRGECETANPRAVAVKVLQGAALHPRLRSRLHSERHILATLDHPYIARLSDSGELEDGTPYLVMDLVDGVSLDEYCDQRSLIVRDRIELFVEVCSAVHYAHRNLVVHRDIKASNIYVTDQGTPKLLDFGVAKLLAPESLAHTLPVTRLQERILTPENAAPEQVLGRPITTATDVFALGVLLYQLLSGRSPYRLLSYSQLQLERAICMDEPARPSQMVMAKFKDESDEDRERIAARRGSPPERLRARLNGDLDAIVAMAMRKEPDRRYPSVEALADDLRRHLAGQPVRARQGDWRYNSVKFLRRHLLGAVVTGVIFLGIAFVAVLTLRQNIQINKEKQAAEEQRERAQEVSGFLVNVFSAADPFTAQGKELTAKDLLDAGEARIRDNTSLHPEVRAELLESIGLAYRHEGHYDRAIPLFEQAVAIRKDMSPVDNRLVAASLADLSRALSDGGHFAAAEGYIQEALALSDVGGPASRQTADIYLQYGHMVLAAESDPVRARSLFRNALAIYRALPGDRAFDIGESYNSLAAASTWSGDFKTAEKEQRDALKILEVVTRSNPERTEAMGTLGYILVQTGKYAEADAVLHETLDIERSVFGQDNPRVSFVEESLSTLYAYTGDLKHAISLAQDALKLTTAQVGSHHYMHAYRLDGLADLKLQDNDLDGAEADAKEALDIYSNTLPANHAYVASTRRVLGEIFLAKGQLSAAESELRKALDINISAFGADNWRIARVRASLGWVLIKEGRDIEGEPMLAAAQQQLTAVLGAQHPDAMKTTARLTEYFLEHHREADAAQLQVPVH